MWRGDWGGGGWVLMSVAMVLFWAAVIATVVWIVRALDDSRRRSAEQPRRSTALDILDERYARGELTDDEYRIRRTLLTTR